ncbi:MAG: hypothetical protein K2X47_01345 [Bdellovibrionales bacterium]|nr:hypothetical protein [Bdellovibrionales bacterium]
MKIPGINIQWPWSEMLLSGKKTVETRGYKLPDHYIGKPLALIETKNPNRKGKAKIIGVIRFEKSYLYETKTAWLKEKERHLVTPDDESFGFKATKPKWGWPVVEVFPIESVNPPRRRGIIFASSCTIKDKNV